MTTDPQRDPRQDLLDAIDSTYAYGVLGYASAEVLLAAYDASRAVSSSGRAALLHETADAVFALDYDDLVDEADEENLGSMREAWDLGTIHAEKLLRRLANEAEFVATPCAPMVPCEDGGEPCDVHERLMSHHDGSHELCAPNCETPDGPRRVAAEEQPAETQDGAARVASLEQEVKRLGLMVDEYGSGAGALTDKLQRVRDMHRETCPLVLGGLPVPAFRCGMCELLDAPAPPVVGEQPDTQEAVPIHACPPNGSGLTPCCGRTPFEMPGDRMTDDPDKVTCPGSAAP